MSALLFKLYNVPEDEATEVRQLLKEHGFQTYETQGGFFGLGVAAIWLTDKTQKDAARKVIDDYQAERSALQRQHYAEQKARGEAPTVRQAIARNPIRFFATVIVIGIVLLVSFVPVWSLMTS